MGKANRVYASKLPEYLMTHPVTSSRIADAMGRAEQHAYRQNADNLRYHLARADLVQRRFERPEDAIRELELMIQDGRFRNAAAAHYAVARAQIRAKRLDDADATLAKLLQEHPDTLEFVVTKAEAETARGDRAAALRRLEAALARRPASYALNVAYAETALAHGESAKALEQLQRYLAFRPDEPRLFRLMAQAAGESGKVALGHEYMAEHYYLNGDIERAIVQLDIALDREKLNFFDASRIESRRAELKAEEALEKERSARP
jgi:predicted Zn-dependent protease